MSLKEISLMTGVSVSTVSRVLSGAPGAVASKEVRDKVLKAAQETGYTPNTSAQQLRKGVKQASSRRVAIVTARISDLNADPFFYELCILVQEELLKAGCSAFMSDGESVLPECSGVIILGRANHELLERLKKTTPNIVGIWRNLTDFDTDEVVCDGRKAAVMATEYLIKLGHTKIAYIGDCSFESRYVGYCDALIKNNVPIDYPLIIPTLQTFDEGYSAMEKLYPSGASAVFCANDITAAGALKKLAEYGRRGRKIAVISIDNIAAAQETKPLLTTINIPRSDMAHMAVKVLFDRLENGHSEKLRVEFPCRLIRRESCF